MARKIRSIEYNGEQHDLVEIGSIGPVTGKCIKITEHPAQGEGDRWFYDVYYDSGKLLRIFNPSIVLYDEEINEPF